MAPFTDAVCASIAWFEKIGWRRNFSWNDGGEIEAGADQNDYGKAQFAGVGAGKCEVTYTHAKNVRKPKGVAPGRVTVAHAKTLVVDANAARLERLLNTLQSQ